MPSGRGTWPPCSNPPSHFIRPTATVIARCVDVARLSARPGQSRVVWRSRAFGPSRRAPTRRTEPPTPHCEVREKCSPRLQNSSHSCSTLGSMDWRRSASSGRRGTAGATLTDLTALADHLGHASRGVHERDRRRQTLSGSGAAAAGGSLAADCERIVRVDGISARRSVWR